MYAVCTYNMCVYALPGKGIAKTSINMSSHVNGSTRAYTISADSTLYYYTYADTYIEYAMLQFVIVRAHKFFLINENGCGF